MINFNRIRKDCFWDFKFTDSEIYNLASSKDQREQDFLFQKILLNSTSLFNDLKIFDKKILEKLINDYKVPTFNFNHTFKRINMAEAYFLDKPIRVNELKWVV